MKKIFAILGVLLLMSMNCMAQSEEEEANLFGLTRSASSDNALSVDFGKLESKIVERIVTIENKENATMKITGFAVPAGVSAMSLQKGIEEFGKGKVKIIIDPNYSGAVNGEEIVINVSYFDRRGNQSKNAQLTYKIRSN